MQYFYITTNDEKQSNLHVMDCHDITNILKSLDEKIHELSTSTPLWIGDNWKIYKDKNSDITERISKAKKALEKTGDEWSIALTDLAVSATSLMLGLFTLATPARALFATKFIVDLLLAPSVNLAQIVVAKDFNSSFFLISHVKDKTMFVISEGSKSLFINYVGQVIGITSCFIAGVKFINLDMKKQELIEKISVMDKINKKITGDIAIFQDEVLAQYKQQRDWIEGYMIATKSHNCLSHDIKRYINKIP